MTSDVMIERRVFATGEKIFSEGSNGRTAFIVQKGTVDIVRKMPDGTDKHLANIGAGAIFGEMALIDDKPRMATALSNGETVVIVVTEQMFHQKLDKADPFIRGLMHILSDTIREMSSK